jgi:preprotein translocase subunit SecE
MIGMNMINIKKFVDEVKSELKKVTWPDRALTVGTTLVVIILVIVMAAFLGVVDISLAKIIQYLVG